MAGELFSTEALRRGLAGIVIDGRCRDSRTLVEIELPVYARGVAPSAPPARLVPVIQVPLTLGGVEVRPGDILLGDDDGVVVGDDAELEAAIETAETIQFREEALRASISAGTSLFTALNFDEHVARLRAGQPSSSAIGRSPTGAPGSSASGPGCRTLLTPGWCSARSPTPRSTSSCGCATPATTGHRTTSGGTTPGPAGSRTRTSPGSGSAG